MGHPETLNISPVKNTEKGPKSLQIDKEIEKAAENNKSQNCIVLQSKAITVFPLSDIANNGTHITHVNIDYNKISELPAQISELLPLLQVFTANGNELSILPDDFGEFCHLRELCLCENKLVSLPESLSKLIKLQELKLNANCLKRLDAEIGQNVSLQVLSVNQNELIRLPATLGLLRNLRVLEANCNKLESLPSTLNFLESLTNVDFSNNRLTHIPESFGDLKNLTHIDLSQNRIQHFCENFQSTKTLQQLYLDQNVFTKCPKWFKDLENIVEISMKFNELFGLALPDGFGLSSKKLTILDLRGNFIQELPISFGHLTSLESLLLGTSLNHLERSPCSQNGNWLSVFPYNFVELISLTKLHVEENHLRALPEDIGKLVHLEDIYLGSNMLVELPPSFTKLVALKRCQLSKNHLAKLPEDIGTLHLLIDLHLDFNKLKTLPTSMKSLTNLELLNLSDNKLKEWPSDIIPSMTGLTSLSLNHNRFVVPDCGISNILKKVNYVEQSHEDVTNSLHGRHNMTEVPRQSVVQATNECLEETNTRIVSDTRVQDKQCSDEEEDWNEETDKISISSSSVEESNWRPDQEESWDVELDHANDGSTFEGQFELDDEEPVRSMFVPAPVRFDSYGNCSSMIYLEILRHLSTPHMYHAPAIHRVLYVPECEVPGQFDNDISSEDVDSGDINSGDNLLCSVGAVNRCDPELREEK